MKLISLLLIITVAGPSLPFILQNQPGFKWLGSKLSKIKNKTLNPNTKQRLFNNNYGISNIFSNAPNVVAELPAYTVDRQKLVFYLNVPFVPNYYFMVDFCKLFIFGILVRCFDSTTTNTINYSGSSSNSGSSSSSISNSVQTISRPSVTPLPPFSIPPLIIPTVRPVTSAPVTPATAAPPQVSSRLVMSDQASTFSQARIECQQLGGDLWSPTGDANAMLHLLQDHGIEVPSFGAWLGVVHEGGQTKMMNGDVIDDSTIDGTPQNGDGVIISLIPLIEEPAFEFDRPDASRPFICEI